MTTTENVYWSHNTIQSCIRQRDVVNPKKHDHQQSFSTIHSYFVESRSACQLHNMWRSQMGVHQRIRSWWLCEQYNLLIMFRILTLWSPDPITSVVVHDGHSFVYSCDEQISISCSQSGWDCDVYAAFPHPSLIQIWCRDPTFSSCFAFVSDLRCNSYRDTDALHLMINVFHLVVEDSGCAALLCFVIPPIILPASSSRVKLTTSQHYQKSFDPSQVQR